MFGTWEHAQTPLVSAKQALRLRLSARNYLIAESRIDNPKYKHKSMIVY